MGTGASAIQCIPHLAESARHLYVFQRTPSAVGVRGNRPTPEVFSAELRSRPGWQRERMYNFHAIITGRPVEVDLVDDGWTNHMARVWNPRMGPDMSIEEIMYQAEADDYEIMEIHRRRIDETVRDPEKAEILKPYYRYLCKRPCFHDEYLPAFNLPNVTLVDCPSGIERVTETGLICDGKEYELDCLVYATGFEAELTPFPRRAGHEIVGRGGLRLADKWAVGAATLHGIMSRGFPNLFIMPAPGQQAVICANITLVSVEGAEHIAATIEQLDRSGVRVFDVSQQAEDEYVAQIVGAYRDTSPVMAACTPSRLNFEGNPKGINPRSGCVGRRHGRLLGLRQDARRLARARRLPWAGSGSPGRGSLSTASPGVDEPRGRNGVNQRWEHARGRRCHRGRGRNRCGNCRGAGQERHVRRDPGSDGHLGWLGPAE